MKNCISFFTLIFISLSCFAQQGINYKAIIKDDIGNVLATTFMNVQFTIHQNSPTGTIVYQEDYNYTTDVNGMLIINIGSDPTPSIGVFEDINWSADSHFLQLTIAYSEGTINFDATQFMAVPYALSSKDNLWQSNNNNAIAITEKVGIGTNTPEELLSLEDINNASIKLQAATTNDTTGIRFENGPKPGFYSYYKMENRFDRLRISVDSDLTTATEYDEIINITNNGTINTDGALNAGTTLSAQNGASINEFSTDGTLAGNSNSAVPTEAAVKTYVDNFSGSTPTIFKVRGNGFAVKDLDANTTVETDIWDIETYDTKNTFSTTTKRYTIPETGYYYLHAVVRQSNAVTTSFFRINFNVDPSSRYSQIVDGDDVKINVSGIYFLTAGQEVFVFLRNFGSGDVRIDGTGSWFEGYKID